MNNTNYATKCWKRLTFNIANSEELQRKLALEVHAALKITATANYIMMQATKKREFNGQKRTKLTCFRRQSERKREIERDR